MCPGRPAISLCVETRHFGLLQPSNVSSFPKVAVFCAEQIMTSPCPHPSRSPMSLSPTTVVAQQGEGDRAGGNKALLRMMLLLNPMSKVAGVSGCVKYWVLQSPSLSGGRW